MSNPLGAVLDLVENLFDTFRDRSVSAPPLAALDRALQTAAREHTALRTALAKAIGIERRERQRLETLIAQIGELEGRAILALQGQRTDLARRAAENLALLEAQRVSQSALCAEARNTVKTLQLNLDSDRLRLQKLNQGRQVAAIRGPALSNSHLARAEDLLAEIASLQPSSIDAAAGPHQITQELADAGFGASAQKDVDAILERLQAAAQGLPAPTVTAIASEMNGKSPTNLR